MIPCIFKRLLLILVVCGSGCHFLGAQYVRGKVVDSITRQPVAYAAVQYAPNTGVITNEEGYFQFQPEDANWHSITISCLGYENKVIPMKRFESNLNIIGLREAVVQLNEVFLSNKLPDAETIMEKVRQNVPANYPESFKALRVFSRQTGYVDFEDLEFEVAKATGVSREGLQKTNHELDSLSNLILQNRSIDFRDYLGDLYFKDRETAKLQVEKATVLRDAKRDFSPDKIQEKAQQIVLQYLDTTQTYKIKTGILKIEDSLSLNESFKENGEPAQLQVASLRTGAQDLLNTSRFYEDSFLDQFLQPKAYTFRFNKATFLNGEPIYIVDYAPRKSRSKYAGKVFVNGNDFAIVKINYSYAQGERGRKFNMKLLLGIKFIEDREEGTVLFKKAVDGTYEASYIQRTRGNYFYISRPVKFIENSSEKDKVSFKFKLAGSSREKEEILVTTTSSLEESRFREIEEVEKTPVLELKKYDASIWQDKETLQPLEEMRQFNAME